MGEVKRRGTFEERKAAAIKKQEELYEQIRKEYLKKYNSMTEEQRQRKRLAEIHLTRLYGMIFGYSYFNRKPIVPSFLINEKEIK